MSRNYSFASEYELRCVSVNGCIWFFVHVFRDDSTNEEPNNSEQEVTYLFNECNI